MKYLIIGTGYLGTRILNAWEDAVASQGEIHSVEDALREIDRVQPDVVINAAGVTGNPNVDWCETNQIATAKGNVELPLLLAEATQQRSIHLIHLGSGCIFYGISPQPAGWREEDATFPLAYYSRTKLAADLLLSNMSHVAIVRLRLPVDTIPSPKNLIDKLASYKKVIDVTNSVTIIDDLLVVLRGIAEKKATGIFHAINPGPLRYRELLKLYKEFVDPLHHCEWIADDDLVQQGLAQKQRSTVILQSTRLTEIGLTMRPIEDAIKDTIKKYAEARKQMLLEIHSAPTPASQSFFVHGTKPKELKGIITAGGSGTRLAPLTNASNKHLLPIFDKPMILYPLLTLLSAGVKQIMITTGPEHAHAFVKLLGSGTKYNCNITYRIQDMAGGIAQAVHLGKDFVGNDNCIVHLGDNIFEEPFDQHAAAFKDGSLIFYKKVADAHQYGVIEIDDRGHVLSIEEKPAQPKSNLAQLGLYFYDPTVFEIIDALKPSSRGELEISDVNSEFMKQDKLTAREITGRWFDAGTFRDLKRANEYFAEQAGIY
ncbi:sugar nucleotide-binding protein [Patescibacteria group bacterium]|nr:sugar nucleotide-binding protein [Patescibacteria group bacterium]